MAAMVTAAGIPGRVASARRLLIALGASLLVHYLIAGGWNGSGGAQRAAVVPPLQARLEPRDQPTIEPVFSATPDATVRLVPPLAAARRRPAAAAPRPAVPQAGTDFSNGSDNRFYLARELDEYPAPLAPLHLPGAAGSVRLWVSIDRAGQVVDVAVADAEPPDMFEQRARDLVLATQFAPARKAGYPVKSRVLLVLRYGS